MLKIKPIYNDAYQCYQSVCASIARFYNRNYELAFLSSWNFIYKNIAEEKFGNRIIIKEKIEFIELLDFFYGIEIIRLNEFFNQKKHDIIKNELLQQRPVLIYTDTYYCNWCRFYLKQHFQHIILALGNYNEHTIVCIDPYFSNKHIMVDLDCFREIQWDIGVVHLKQPKSSLNMLEQLIDIVLYSAVEDGIRIFEYIDMFVQDFEKDFCILKEFKGENNIKEAPIFNVLQKARKNTLSFAEALSCVSETYDSKIQDIVVIVKEIASMWSQFTNVLVKMYLTNNKGLKINAIQILKIIVKKEKAVWDGLMYVKSKL